jgi:hypothetical protein
MPLLYPNQPTAGSVWAVTITYTDPLGVLGIAGAVFDPGTVTFQQQPPGGSTTSSTPAKVSVGVYRGTIALTAGTTRYGFVSTNNLGGLGAATVYGSIFAAPAPI